MLFRSARHTPPIPDRSQGRSGSGSLARIIRERGATLTPTLSLGEGAVPIPSPPEGERDRVRGSLGRGTRIRGIYRASRQAQRRLLRSRAAGLIRTAFEGYPLIHARPPRTFPRVWRSPGGAGPVPRLAPRVSARRACAGAARRAGPDAGAAAHPHDDRGNESLTGGAATRILDALRPRISSASCARAGMGISTGIMRN